MRQAHEVTMAVVVGRPKDDGTIEYEDLGVTDRYTASPIRRAMARARAEIERTVHGLKVMLAPRARLAWTTHSMAEFVVDGGNAIVVNRVRGTGTEPKYVGWGIGAGATTQADTSLFTEKATDLSSGAGTRATGTTSVDTTSDTNDTWVCTATITATGAGSVTNAGCFDNATIGSGSLYCKGDHPARTLAIGQFITYIFAVRHSN